MNVKRRILVVEDEESLVTGLEYALGKEGYDVDVARDGRVALEMLATSAPDLVLLDVMLPGRSGLDVLKSLRRDGRTVPVMLLTARNGEADVVQGLDLGADDYITKPFSLAELLARVRVRLKSVDSSAADTPNDLAIGPAHVLLAELRIEVTLPDGTSRTSDLSLREVDMLRLLWRERGRPVTRERFLDEVWGHDTFPTTRTVDQHVVKLRQKLEVDPKAPVHLLTAFGVGYRLEV